MDLDLIKQAAVTPHWLSGNNHFWYRRDLPEEKVEYALVDAVNGIRQSFQTQEELAEQIQVLTGKPADFGEEDSEEWTGPLHNDDMKGTFRKSASPSPYGAQGKSLRFVNQCSDALLVHWIDHAGIPVLRETIEPGKSKVLGSWTGHIWQVSDKSEKHGKLFYVAPKEEEKDVIVVNEELLSSEENEIETKTDLPRVFVRESNLWVQDENGEEHKITNTGAGEEGIYDEERIYLSPDKQHVVAWQYTPEQEHLVHLIESSPEDQLQPKIKSIQYLKPGDRVRVDRPRMFDLKQRIEIPTDDTLFKNPFDLRNIGWDKSGDVYRFIFNERGHKHLRVIEMSTDGHVQALLEESSSTFIDYSNKLYWHVSEDSRELLWASERDGWNHLYLYDLEKRQLKNQITTGEWLVVSVDRVDEEKRQVFLRVYGFNPAENPYYAHLVRVSFDGSDLQVLTAGDGNHTWKWSPDHRYLLDTWSRVDLPPSTSLRDAETGKQTLALHIGTESQLEGASLTLFEKFAAPGRDGKTMIYGVILKPADFDPQKKYPIIEWIYAGPQMNIVPAKFSSPRGFQRWTDGKFLLVIIDGMGTNWRSKAFHDVSYKNLHDAGFPDRIAWMKAAAQERPWMDLDHVGVFGTSAGGQNAAAAVLFQGDFYKVAAADSGCHDNRMDKIWWNEQWMGWPVDKSYEEASNVVNAHKLQGKLLLIVGDMDDNVDPASTLQFVNALNKADRDYEFLFIPGGRHGCGGNTDIGKKRVAEFFRRHLIKE